MPLLRELNVGENLFTGPIPAGVGLLTSLNTFVASENFFTGPVLDSFGALTGLEILRLNDNS